MLIGITGTLGAGKGTVVKYLKSKGFNHYSVSKVLGELVEREGNPKTRDFMGPMATRLLKEFPGGVAEKIYREKFLVENPANAIIESLHRQSEANFIRSVGGHIIAVDADLKTRYARTISRNEGEKDQVTLEEFKQHSFVEDDGGGDESRDNNIRAVIESTEFVVQNIGSLEELHAQVEAVLAALNESTAKSE